MRFVACSEFENPSATQLSLALLSEQRQMRKVHQEFKNLKKERIILVIRETLIMVACFCGLPPTNDPDYMHRDVSRQKFVNWILVDMKTIAIMEDLFNTAANLPYSDTYVNTQRSTSINVHKSIGPILRLLHGSLAPRGNSVQANSLVHGLSFNNMIEGCHFLRQ